MSFLERKFANKNLYLQGTEGRLSNLANYVTSQNARGSQARKSLSALFSKSINWRASLKVQVFCCFRLRDRTVFFLFGRKEGKCLEERRLERIRQAVCGRCFPKVIWIRQWASMNDVQSWTFISKISTCKVGFKLLFSLPGFKYRLSIA